MLSPDQCQDLNLTLKDFPRARTLPHWVYTCSQVFNTELAQLFGKQWVCVGHHSVFPASSLSCVDLAHHSLLISCDEQGQLTAFHNVCRHRGTRLLNSGRHSGELLVCPYHQWSYDLDGKLKAAPGMQGRAGFEPAEHGLLPAALALWQGLVFISPGQPEQSPAQRLADFPLPGPDLAALQVVAAHEYEVQANWKLLGENYNECYHCPSGHPQLHQITRSAADAGGRSRGDGFTGGPMELRPGYNTMSESGRTDRLRLKGWPAGSETAVHYYHVYPNVLLSIMPDYLMTHLLMPLSPDRVAVQTHWLFDPAEIAAEGFDPGDVVAFWDLTNKQDWRLCERAQKGHRSGAPVAGMYHPDEQCVHDFDRWYAAWLRQQSS